MHCYSRLIELRNSIWKALICKWWQRTGWSMSFGTCLVEYWRGATEGFGTGHLPKRFPNAKRAHRFGFITVLHCRWQASHPVMEAPGIVSISIHSSIEIHKFNFWKLLKTHRLHIQEKILVSKLEATDQFWLDNFSFRGFNQLQPIKFKNEENFERWRF